MALKFEKKIVKIESSNKRIDSMGKNLRVKILSCLHTETKSITYSTKFKYVKRRRKKIFVLKQKYFSRVWYKYNNIDSE